MPHKINVGLFALAALAAVLAEPSVDRRASMGFMGMRGKKDDQSGDSGIVGAMAMGDEASAAAVELDKRTLVFRRPLFDSSNSVEGFKRAMGFVGMRGKKEYKGPSSGSSSFFGMRGKKVPSADAFFGVRGKKWLNAADEMEVERAVFDLHRIIDSLRSGRERNFAVATTFDEEMR
ncbi:Hypothetical protein CINCED_3A013032 [Cinara cedri]|uniref:Uncharacterized protein n=1 Tax=Cinara cedri TaxID=506608 RepID=A0A5E4NSJ6_9HEMI|nr:Hypothetical protein CINCED_3A013032 [Cinara cedri]